MKEWLKVGAKVVCVDVADGELTVGRIYTLTEVSNGWNYKREQDVGVLVAEARLPDFGHLYS